MSHEIINRELLKLTPDISILSEESSEKFELENDKFSEQKSSKKNGEFTVNIALIFDQKPVMGVVVVPAKKQLIHLWKV